MQPGRPASAQPSSPLRCRTEGWRSSAPRSSCWSDHYRQFEHDLRLAATNKGSEIYFIVLLGSGDVLDMFTNPEEFFERQARQGTYKGPGVVLFITGLTFALQHVATYYTLGPGRSDFVSIFTILFTAQLLEPLFLWIVFSIAFYGIAASLGGDVLVGRVFRLSGWGFLPLVLTGITWTVGRYVVLRSAPIPDFTSGVLGEELDAYGQIVAQYSGALVAVFLAGCVFFAASIYLWIHAIKKSGTLSTKTATISTVIPVVIYVLLRIQQIL